MARPRPSPDDEVMMMHHLLVGAALAAVASAPASGSNIQSNGEPKIKHMVVMLMENRALVCARYSILPPPARRVPNIFALTLRVS